MTTFEEKAVKAVNALLFNKCDSDITCVKQTRFDNDSQVEETVDKDSTWEIIDAMIHESVCSVTVDGIMFTVESVDEPVEYDPSSGSRLLILKAVEGDDSCLVAKKYYYDSWQGIDMMLLSGFGVAELKSKVVSYWWVKNPVD